MKEQVKTEMQRIVPAFNLFQNHDLNFEEFNLHFYESAFPQSKCSIEITNATDFESVNL